MARRVTQNGWDRGAARRRGSPALRALGVFWVLVILALGGGAAALQVMGPPPGAAGQAAAQAGAHAGGPSPPAMMAAAADAPAARQARAPRPAGPIADPDPALEEPSAKYPDAMLPRRGPDGRLPMEVYAGGFDAADPRPRVALVLTGMGLSDADSEAAIDQLPSAVTFAFSPYAMQPERLVAAARAHGHEFLASIPMEPQGYPLNDEGPRALLTGAPSGANADNLEWALSRYRGYAGATGALDGMRGERYAAMPDALGAVEDELARRGLFYVDPRPDQPAPTRVTGRAVDIVVDEPPLRAEIDAKLARLEQLARDHGSALGLAGPPRPVTVDRLAAWANLLAARGILLVPVSAVLGPPAQTAAAGPPAPPLK